MRSNHRAAGILVIVLGVLTVATGLYFLALRPPMLPEDVRVTGVSPDSLTPAFLGWLTVVFRTWGGFVTGFGIVLGGFGVTLLSGHVNASRWGIMTGVVIAFGRFLYSNIVIGSDFLWFIMLLFGLAVATVVALAKVGRDAL